MLQLLAIEPIMNRFIVKWQGETRPGLVMATQKLPGWRKSPVVPAAPMPRPNGEADESSMADFHSPSR